MSTIPKFAYKLRPAYKSTELLIEFNSPESSSDLEKMLFFILEQNGFAFNGAQDLWMNDEIDVA